MTRPCGSDAPQPRRLIWDIDAETPTGEGGDWDPRQLFALAVSNDLKSAFLRLARNRGLVVLAYVSAAHIHSGGPHSRHPRLCVHPCIVVGSPADAEHARGIMAEAYAGWDLANLLRDRPRLELEVTVVDASIAECGLRIAD